MVGGEWYITSLRRVLEKSIPSSSNQNPQYPSNLLRFREYFGQCADGIIFPVNRLRTRFEVLPLVGEEPTLLKGDDHERGDSKANSGKENPPISVRSSGADEDVPLGQLGMTLQSRFDRPHGCLVQGNAAQILLVSGSDNRRMSFPRHTLRPRQHRGGIA